MHHLGDAIVVIELRLQSGDEGPTVLAPCVMPVDYVGPMYPNVLMLANIERDYAKLTRKMGSKAATGGSNLRPKDADGSP